LRRASVPIGDMDSPSPVYVVCILGIFVERLGMRRDGTGEYRSLG
jgi:hypothetical protein